MDETQDVNSQVENDDVQDSMMGMDEDPNGSEASGDAEERDNLVKENDPLSVKKRLGMQAKKHQRELRAMREQLAQLQSLVGYGNRQPDIINEHQNPYPSPGQPAPMSGSEEDRIQRAVRLALDSRDKESRKAQEAASQAHVQKKYARLQDEFDRASDKYEDFDDVVRGDDVPFTPAMRDALLFVNNPAEVAYKLGKNRQELQRISQLHPLDQAYEINQLAFALMGGNGGKASSAPRGSNPLHPAKPNPATSNAVTEKTPASVIRARMKAGTWK